MPNILERCAMLILFLTCTGTVWCQPLSPGTQYRADLRPPEVVFQAGFQSRGTNIDLMHHLTGRSCRPSLSSQQRSYFVSSSSTMAGLFWYLTSDRHLFYNRYFWIYEIERDEQTDFDVATALTHSMYSSNLQRRYTRRTMDHIIRLADSSTERVTPSGIPGRRIRSATMYHGSNALFAPVAPPVQNPSFVAQGYTGQPFTLPSRYLPMGNASRTAMEFYSSDESSEVSSCASSCSEDERAAGMCMSVKKVQAWVPAVF